MDPKQIEYRKVSGDKDSTAQTFFSNKNACYFPNQTIAQNYEVPMYIASGGTSDYYGQDPNAIFSSLNNPFIRYYFTGNTSSFSGSTSIVFRIYKLDYDTYKKYQPDFIKLNTEQQNTNHQQTQEETIIVNGQKTVTTKITNTINTATTENAEKVDLTSKDDIKYLLENPFYEFEVPSSNVTLPYYDLVLPPFVKSTGTTSGNFIKKLFDDKSQFFVKTIFKFDFPISNAYVLENKIYTSQQSQEFNDFMLSEQLIYPSYYNNSQVYNYESYVYPNSINNFNVVDFPVYSADTYFESMHDLLITAGTFSNFLVGGRFFTYFQVPNKPKLEEPYVEGQLDTFSPKFYYSNIIDGDYSQVEISYGTGFSFSDEVVVFKIEKNLYPDSNIQEASVSVRADATNFTYRIGNFKKINNIFGVDQRIVTYTDSMTACTQNLPATTFVFVQNDSPYGGGPIAPYVNPPNIDNSVPGFYTLSGQVSGSVVSNCLLTLTYPNNTQFSLSSDTQGFYSFSGAPQLYFGVFNLKTEYRGYDISNQQFELRANKELGYTIELLWSDEYDTFGDKENDIMIF